MTDKERHVFEKSLQKDPFAEEASEGFQITDPQSAEKDILEIRNRIDKRISAHKRVFRYRIAASIAVLMVLSSVFIILERKPPSEQVAQTPVDGTKKETRVLTEEKPGQGVKVFLPRAQETVKKSQMAVQKPAEPVRKMKEELISDEKQEVGVPAEVTVAEQVVREEKAAAPVSASVVSGVKTFPVKGKIISSEDNKPIAGVNVTLRGTHIGTITDSGGNFSLDLKEAGDKTLVATFIGMESKEFKAKADSSYEIKLEPAATALNEMVVVGYGIKDNAEETETEGYTPPQPVTGKAAFDRYIRNNIHRPDSGMTGQRVVLVVSFMVDQSGKIDSITAVRSPGKLFSDEAIRLIREGPEWKPAEKNGNIIRDKVRIRIVF